MLVGTNKLNFLLKKYLQQTLQLQFAINKVRTMRLKEWLKMLNLICVVTRLKDQGLENEIKS